MSFIARTRAAVPRLLSSQRPVLRQHGLSLPRSGLPSPMIVCRLFSSSKEKQDNGDKSDNNSGGGGGGDGGEPVSFFSAFARSVKRQIEENRDLQQNVKLLSDETNKVADSEAVKRAKEAMAKGSKVVGAVAAGTAQAIHTVAEMPAVKKTTETISYVGEKVADTAQKVADPILETEAAKTIAKGVKSIQKDLASDSAVRYAEYKPKHIREAEKAQRLAEAAKDPFSKDSIRMLTADPNAGQSVVLHKTSKWAASWNDFKENSLLSKSVSAIGRRIEESDDPLIDRLRSWFSPWEDTEEARVITAIRMVDGVFRMDTFLREATEWMVPDILEAYLHSDAQALKAWCTERAWAKFSMAIENQHSQGLISDCKLLDVRKIQIHKAIMLDDELPLLSLTCQTNEILNFRNKKGELVVGVEDHIDQAYYSIIFTKAQCIDPQAENNPATDGWVLFDLHRQAF
ncbi:uncharacterized protein BJ171DRAFT_490426 [Polychytrium aggregatum]|uniref:uncharacterized protein n=1 Tax=Polychytrium aggregatum TaxID=110093 RepID=UPI0022FE6AF2|nr:uncharacterized protein BJ171DRAFT_490426 [Polychytrium aggregatum]KAI9208171.1 hypothetical protein BJ171DRAFT_490426 [Polychytrium aggregatum]